MSTQNIKTDQELSQGLPQQEELISLEDESLKCTHQFELGKKRSWTANEDAYLIKLVQKYGAQKWTSIAQHLPGKHFIIQVEQGNNAERDGIII